MTHRLAYNPHVHTSQVFRVQVDALDLPPERFPTTDLVPIPLAELPRGRFDPDPGEIRDVEAILRAVTGRSEVPRLVLLNANCSDLLPLRKWSEASYTELARRILAEHPDVFVAFTGALAEAGPVDGLVRSIGDPRCVSLAGLTTLRQLLVVYHLAELLVTNDSGPAHFASLTHIDVVTLFGPETPKLFAVLSPRSHVHWAETACSPCVNAYNNRVSACTDNVCMQRIGVEDVFASVREALAARASGEHRPAATPHGPAAEPLWVPPQRTAEDRYDAGRRRVE